MPMLRQQTIRREEQIMSNNQDKTLNKSDMDKKQSTLPIMKRLLGYVLKNYKFSCIAVLACIIASALITLSATLFIQKLVDNYIIPLTQSAVHDYAPLASALIKLSAVLIVGVLCSYIYNRIMVNVGQGTLKKLRFELFTNMESLPIKYFDTHAHGDIMSVYTNDIDTLRQLISQSIPQVLNSLITLVSTFVSMIVLDIPLTIVSVIMVAIMLFVTSKLILTPLTSFIVVSFFRKCIDAQRPYVKYNITPLVKKDKEGESMPSRHVFSITIIAMCWFYIYQPVGIVLFVLTAVLAVLRVITGVHFIRDVVAGIVVGVLCGFVGLWIL